MSIPQKLLIGALSNEEYIPQVLFYSLNLENHIFQVCCDIHDYSIGYPCPSEQLGFSLVFDYESPYSAHCKQVVWSCAHLSYTFNQQSSDLFVAPLAKGGTLYSLNAANCS